MTKTELLNVDTRKFELSHGKAPRGYGHWGFIFDGKDDDPLWHIGSFTEAKKYALRWAVAKGHANIEVAP